MLTAALTACTATTARRAKSARDAAEFYLKRATKMKAQIKHIADVACMGSTIEFTVVLDSLYRQDVFEVLNAMQSDKRKRQRTQAEKKGSGKAFASKFHGNSADIHGRSTHRYRRRYRYR